jgi:hypothetical protein
MSGYYKIHLLKNWWLLLPNIFITLIFLLALLLHSETTLTTTLLYPTSRTSWPRPRTGTPVEADCGVAPLLDHRARLTPPDPALFGTVLIGAPQSLGHEKYRQSAPKSNDSSCWPSPCSSDHPHCLSVTTVLTLILYEYHTLLWWEFAHMCI